MAKMLLVTGVTTHHHDAAEACGRCGCEVPGSWQAGAGFCGAYLSDNSTVALCNGCRDEIRAELDATRQIVLVDGELSSPVAHSRLYRRQLLLGTAPSGQNWHGVEGDVKVTLHTLSMDEATELGIPGSAGAIVFVFQGQLWAKNAVGISRPQRNYEEIYFSDGYNEWRHFVADECFAGPIWTNAKPVPLT